MNAEIAPTIEALLQPLAPESPGGIDCKFDPRNEVIRKEIAKLEGLNARDVDWKLVADQSSELIGQVSKDLSLCCQLTLSWYHLRGLDGLADGITCLDGILREFWSNCFPPASRIRGRINQINWLVERLVPHLSNYSIEAKDRTPLERLRVAFDRLQSTINDRFTNESPSLSELDRTLQRCEITLTSISPNAETSLPSEAPNNQAPSPTEPPASPMNLPTQDTTPASANANAQTKPPSSASGATPIPPSSQEQVSETPNGTNSPEQAFSNLQLQASPWIEAISSEHPAGQDARYSSEHETARAEIAKAQAIQSNPIDWSVVHDNASTVLKSLAKDITIATYFSVALLHRDGIVGLNLGLLTTAEIVDRFWDNLFPEKRRMRGRVAALTWLIEQIESFAENLQLEPSDRDSIQVLELVGKRFSEVVRERFIDECPPLRSLSDTIARLQLSIPAAPTPEINRDQPPISDEAKPEQSSSPPNENFTQKKEQRPEDESSRRQSATKVAAPTVATVSNNLDDINGFLFDTGQNLVSAAGNLRRANPFDPLAYRLIRTGLWLHIDRPPPADASGKTEIPPWPEDRRKQLETLANNQKWEIILDESESDLRQHRFCLDLHRFTSTALRYLGEKNLEAREQVRIGLATVIERIPALLQLSFQDGSPFADQETLHWIRSEVLQASASQGTSSSGADDPQESSFDEQISELEKNLSNGSLSDYLPTLESENHKIVDPRQRFAYRLKAAECCLNHGEAKVAALLFSGLVDDAKRHQLESWEPKRYAACLSGLILARRKIAGQGQNQPDPQSQREEIDLLNQLGKLDLQMATRLLPWS